jgi:hypothetical protein
MTYREFAEWLESQLMEQTDYQGALSDGFPSYQWVNPWTGDHAEIPDLGDCPLEVELIAKAVAALGLSHGP